VIPSFFTETYK